MAEGFQVDGNSVARRCLVRTPDYKQLTPLDWVVLDFTDGLRTFDVLLSMIPASRTDLVASFVHLRLLGFLAWGIPRDALKSGVSSVDSVRLVGNGRPASNYHRPARKVRLVPAATSAARAAVPKFSDEVCSQYLPPGLFADFRAFVPTQTNPKLDISTEMQAFTEYLYSNLANLSAYDILGLTEGKCRRSDVKRAYLRRAKQFHPDRYFRKNIAPFGNQLSDIFKAVTKAFATLQAELK